MKNSHYVGSIRGAGLTSRPSVLTRFASLGVASLLVASAAACAQNQPGGQSGGADAAEESARFPQPGDDDFMDAVTTGVEHAMERARQRCREAGGDC